MSSSRPPIIVILSMLFYIFEAIALGSYLYAFAVIPYVSLVPFIGWLSVIVVLNMIAEYYMGSK